jgi:hypothetical protein
LRLNEPSRCGHSHGHTGCFGITRRFGWTLELNTDRPQARRRPRRRPNALRGGRFSGNGLRPAIPLAGAPEPFSTGLRGVPPARGGVSLSVSVCLSIKLLLRSTLDSSTTRAGHSPCIRPGVAVEEKSRSLYGFRARSTRPTSIAPMATNRPRSGRLRGTRRRPRSEVQTPAAGLVDPGREIRETVDSAHVQPHRKDPKVVGNRKEALAPPAS